MTNKTHSCADKRGFTIVEMLVAVAILVMVIGPLLGGFITSQRITTKAYYLGEATLVSKNIIETIRAEGVEAFLTRAGGEAFGGEGTVTGSADTGVYEITIEGIPSSMIGNVSAGISNDVMFDARITIDASVYRRVDDDDEPLINDHGITDYLPLDAVFVQPRGEGLDPDLLALEEFKGELSLLGIDEPSDLAQRFNRVITLDVQRIPAGPGIDNLSMTITYDYELPGVQYSAVSDYSISYDIYWERLQLGDELDDDGNPLPLPIVSYLFYKPYYGAAGTHPDSIVVNNQDMLPLNAFIVKQRPEGWTEDYNDLAQEGMYRATIHQVENISLITFFGEGFTRVFSNFRENFVVGGMINQANFEHRVRYGPYWYTTVETESDLLVLQTPRDRMFAINVEVFHAGELDGRAIYSYEATHLE